jgi:hypothetical protein
MSGGILAEVEITEELNFFHNINVIGLIELSESAWLAYLPMQDNVSQYKFIRFDIDIKGRKIKHSVITENQKVTKPLCRDDGELR